MIYRLLLREAKVTRAEQRAFARQVYRLIKNTGKVEEKKVAAMTELLKRARADLTHRAFGLPKGNFTRSMAEILKAETNRVMGEFTARAASQIRQAQGDFAEMGREFTDELTELAGRKPSLLGIRPELVENAATRSADLIRSLSASQIGRASDILNRGVITGASVFDVSKELAGTFDKGLAQMENIARTEMMGIHSQVEQATLEDMAKTTPGLKKEWVTVIDSRTREEHVEANGQSVPVDEPFIVGGEPLMFPGDPNGSPWNICQCRCESIPDFSEVPEEAAGAPLPEIFALAGEE